jgi:MFS family permease
VLRVRRRVSARANTWETRRAIAGGLALGAACGVNILNVGAIPDPLASAYGVSLATVGLFTTALLVAHKLVQIPGGRAIDRFGARRIGLAFLVVGAVGNAVVTIAPEPALVLALRPVIGLSTGIGFVAGIDYIRAAGGAAVAQGLFGGVAMGGGGLALAVVPLLEPAFGWRAPFFFGVAVSIAAALILLLGPRDKPRVAAPTAGPRPTTFQIATDRRLGRLVVLHTATFGSSLLVGTWVVALLVRHGHSQEAAGAIGAVALGLTILSRPFGGWLLDRYPDQIGAALAGSIVVGALGCAGLAAGGPVPAAVVSAAAVGLGAGIAFAPVVTGAMRRRPDAPSAAVGTVNMWGNLFVLAATPLIGYAFSIDGGGRVAFLALAALWAAALIALPGLPSPVAEPAPARVAPAAERAFRS